MATLKEKTAKGLFWGVLNSGTMQVLNLVFGISSAACSRRPITVSWE